MANKKDAEAVCQDCEKLREELEELKTRLSEVKPGAMGSVRLRDDRIVPALVISMKDDSKGKKLTVQWFHDSVAGRNAVMQNVPVGVERGCFNMSEKALSDRFKIERSGIDQVL